MSTLPQHVDVFIIGARPSGAFASALLHKQGHQVLVVEREEFPRFSIGESLLPQCMVYVEEAGMLDAVNNFGFQYKCGAAFNRGDRSHQPSGEHMIGRLPAPIAKPQYLSRVLLLPIDCLQFSAHRLFSPPCLPRS